MDLSLAELVLFENAFPPSPDTETLEQLARDYGEEEVTEFLTQAGLGQYVEAFREAQISGEVLLEADSEVLQELGVASAIDRLKIKELFRRQLQGAVEKYVQCWA